MSAIEMQFSTNEAVALMRALALARQRASRIDERDDLEILHGRIYDQMYRGQQQNVAVAAAAGDSIRERAAQIHSFPSPDHIQVKRPSHQPFRHDGHPVTAAAA